MGTKNGPECPGCSRHCPLDHVRCKYGQKYIDKLKNAQEEAIPFKKHKHKWEKHVHREGLIWNFLQASRSVKRALRRKTANEAQLLAALTSEERAQLNTLIAKITDALE